MTITYTMQDRETVAFFDFRFKFAENAHGNAAEWG